MEAFPHLLLKSSDNFCIALPSPSRISSPSHRPSFRTLCSHNYLPTRPGFLAIACFVEPEQPLSRDSQSARSLRLHIRSTIVRWDRETSARRRAFAIPLSHQRSSPWATHPVKTRINYLDAAASQSFDPFCGHDRQRPTAAHLKQSYINKLAYLPTVSSGLEDPNRHDSIPALPRRDSFALCTTSRPDTRWFALINSKAHPRRGLRNPRAPLSTPGVASSASRQYSFHGGAEPRHTGRR